MFTFPVKIADLDVGPSNKKMKRKKRRVKRRIVELKENKEIVPARHSAEGTFLAAHIRRMASREGERVAARSRN